MRNVKWWVLLFSCFLCSCTFLVDFDRPGKKSEICNDGSDNDGDEFVDCDDPDCLDSPECPAREICNDGSDNDGDEFVDCDDSDCMDSPECSGEEICDDRLDNDGNELIDCDDPDCQNAPNCRPALCNSTLRWQNLDGTWTSDQYFSEVFGDSTCPPNTICSIRNNVAPYPQCYAIEGPLQVAFGACNEGSARYCVEGTMCAISERTGQSVCLPLCAPATDHGCPNGTLCYQHFFNTAGPNSSVQAEIFLCDTPLCNIWNPVSSCGSDQICVPTTDRYGNGACQPNQDPGLPDGSVCTNFLDCRPGSVCERGTNETTTFCHIYCSKNLDNCPTNKHCVVRDVRDAWGICENNN